MVLIGVVGKKRSGKDTLADFVKEKSSKEYIIHSFADPLKEVCKILFGFNESQLYGDEKETEDEYWGVSPRYVLQKIGTDLFRQKLPEVAPSLSYLGDEFWVKQCEKWYMDLVSKDPSMNVIIPDIRFQNELDFIKNNGGIVLEVVSTRVKQEDTHISENNKLNGADIVLENNGTLEEYYDKIKDLMKDLSL